MEALKINDRNNCKFRQQLCILTIRTMVTALAKHAIVTVGILPLRRGRFSWSG